MQLEENVSALLEECTKLHGASHFKLEIIQQLLELERAKTPMASPVEQMFFIVWNYMTGTDFSLSGGLYFPLIPQYISRETGKYRLDFAINFIHAIVNCSEYSIFRGHEIDIFAHFPDPLLGIEIDGHQWHEKTKEQARYDKERERRLVAAGWKILRFTGSEVFNDPHTCVTEAVECATLLGRPYFESIREYLTKKQPGKA